MADYVVTLSDAQEAALRSAHAKAHATDPDHVDARPDQFLADRVIAGVVDAMVQEQVEDRIHVIADAYRAASHETRLIVDAALRI